MCDDYDSERREVDAQVESKRALAAPIAICASYSESNSSLSRRCGWVCSPARCDGSRCEACDDSPRADLALRPSSPGLLYPSCARTSSVHHTKDTAVLMAGWMSSFGSSGIFGVACEYSKSIRTRRDSRSALNCAVLQPGHATIGHARLAGWMQECCKHSCSRWKSEWAASAALVSLEWRARNHTRRNLRSAFNCAALQSGYATLGHARCQSGQTVEERRVMGGSPATQLGCDLTLVCGDGARVLPASQAV